MRKILALLCVLSLFAVNIPAMAETTVGDSTLIYVSIDGNDANDGSETKPLASLIGARNKIRELKNSSPNSAGYTVLVRGGNYAMTEGLLLEKQDSGTADAPVTYCAYPGEEVVLRGGIILNGDDAQKLSENELAVEIKDSQIRDKIYKINLENLEITGLDKIRWKGAYSYPSALVSAGLINPSPEVYGVEVLFNDEGMTLARYPNNGYMYVSEVIEPGWNSNDAGTKLGAPFTISVNDNQIDRWTTAQNPLMYGFWKRDWADQTIPLASIDPVNNTLTGAHGSFLSVSSGRPFYVYNLVEELDVPGEYYIDSQNAVLYFYPTNDISDAEITLTTLTTPVIRINGADYVNFKGIDIIGSQSNAYLLARGNNNMISDCEISYTASDAVKIQSYGNNNGIRDSYIHDVEGGVSLDGGIPNSLTAGKNYVENCEIERFSRLSATYTSAVSVGGVGNLIRYNKIHDGPHIAIEMGGNLNKIMYNEIYDVVKSTDDAGAIYGGLSWVGRGNEIKNNYFHDIDASEKPGSDTAGVAAIMLDGGQCETYILGNVFENIKGRAVWIAGGRDNVVHDNAMINCTEGLLLTDIMYNVDLKNTHYPRLELAPYVTNSSWKRLFARLQNMLALPDEEKIRPLGNVYSNNICYKTELSNKYTNYSGKQVPISLYLDTSRNMVTNTNPGFVDLENRNYQLNENSQVFSKLPNFNAYDFDKMQSLTSALSKQLSDMIVLKTESPLYLCNGEKSVISRENIGITPIMSDNIAYIPISLAKEILDVNISDDNESIAVINGASMISIDNLSLLSDKDIYIADNGVVIIGMSADDAQDINNDLLRYLDITLTLY